MSKLFVGGLADTISRDDLEKTFSAFGHLEDVNLPKNKSGFGFVVYANDRDAEYAIKEMNGRYMHGSKLRVEHGRGGRGGGKNGGYSADKCFKCGKFGHMQMQCKSNNLSTSSMTSREVTEKEPMTWLRLSNKLWIADLHDIDQSTRGGKLLSLKADNQRLVLTQDVISASSYRRRPPMVTMSLSEEGYTPALKELAYVYNTRACYHSEYTVLAGTYWENTIENEGVVRFYEKYLKNDPAVMSHRKFHEDENNKKVECQWSWKQKYSNFPFLLFTTCKPLINEISLQNRTEVDLIIVWNIVQSSKTIGKAYFLPYGIPDIVGEAGIAIFQDENKKLKGICMSEKLRDVFIAEDREKYRRAQELCIPGFPDYPDQSGDSEQGIELLNGQNSCGLSGLADQVALVTLLGLYGEGESSSDDDYSSIETYSSDEDNDSNEEDYFGDNARPYHPKMKKYSSANIIAFVDRCSDWDDVVTEEFQLPTGEDIREVTQKKIFGEGHFISLRNRYVNGTLVSKHCTKRQGSSTMYSAHPNHMITKENRDVCSKIDSFKNEQSRIKEVKPILDVLFSAEYKYISYKTDFSMKMQVNKMVSFGDFIDAQNTEAQEQVVGGTITGYINTVRPFKPGYYLVTVIKPYTDCDPLVMYHHEKVDPRKLMDKVLLMSEDYADYLRDVTNSINRYDWCHFRNWGSTDDNSEDEANKFLPEERSLIYFCATESADKLREAVEYNTCMQSDIIPEVCEMRHKDGRCIALATNVQEYNSGDWIYGKVFQDTSSRDNFALVVNFCMGELDGDIPEQVKSLYPEKKFTSITETKLEFDIHEFEI